MSKEVLYGRNKNEVEIMVADNTKLIGEAYGRIAERMVSTIALSFFRGDRNTAEDCVQSTFLKALTYAGTFRGTNGSSIDTWLKRIAVNEAMSILRKPKPTLTENLEFVDKRAGNSVFSLDLFLEDLEVNLQKARCSDNERMALYIASAGYTPDEVEIVGKKSKSAWESLRCRARKKLQWFYE